MVTDEAAAGGWSLLLSRENLRRSIVLCGGVALHAVNLFIVATILPSVVAEIGGLAYYAWSTTLFVVASIVGAAAVPTLAGRRGVRRAYRLAAFTFFAGSIVCAAAPNMAVLLAGRIAQGLGGGLLVSLCYAAIRRIFPQALWSRAISMVSGVWGAAALAGPFVGGVFAEIGIWRGAFWTVAVAALLFVPLAMRILPAEPGAREGMARTPYGRLSLLAAAALAVSVGGLVGDLGWSCAAVAAAAVAMAALLHLDGRAAADPRRGRLLPTRPYDPRTPLGSVLLTMAMLMIGSSSLLFIPYVLQQVLGLGPLSAGYLSVVESFGWTGAALATSSAGDRTRRVLVWLGPAVQLVGLAGLATVIGLASMGPVPAMVAVGLCLGLVGTGVGLAWAHLGALGMMSAPPEEKGLAASSVATNQMIANTFGSALGGFAANLLDLSHPVDPAALADAARWLFLAFAAAAAIGIVVASRIPGLLRRAEAATRPR